jgi:hypothetical protein
MAGAASPHEPVRGVRVLLGALALLAMLALVGAWSPGPARADGDPASDVLATQSLFLPQDAAMPTRQAGQLTALLQQAARSGYPIRVAVIASASDLGSITELWNQPQSYAQFLGQELSLVYRGPLLVVMPSGFGRYGFPRSPAAQRSTLATPGSRGEIGTAALDAVRSLAAAAGHPLAASAAATATKAASASSATPWVVLGIGALLIAAAWTASLRARPLGLVSRKSSPAT